MNSLIRFFCRLGRSGSAESTQHMVRVVTAIIFLQFAISPLVLAQTEWLNTTEMRRSLLANVGLDWSKRPLQEGLNSLSQSQRIAIWLDRRIDPGQEMTLSTSSATLEAMFEEIAQRIDAAVGFVGPIVYFGPRETATKLWTACELHEENVNRFPTDLRGQWLTRRPVQWEFLSTPRDLIGKAAESVGCTVEGLDAVPHDLWRDGDFPPLTAVEHLTLLLAGFDRTFKVDTNRRVIQIIPFPEKLQIRKEYTLPRTGVPGPEAIGNAAPGATVQRNGSKLVVAGTAENHDAVQRLLRGEKRRPDATAQGETRYTLTIKNVPLGEVLKTLESRAGLKVSVEAAVAEKLKTRVSIDVKEASLEQLLAAAFQETELAFSLTGKELDVKSR